MENPDVNFALREPTPEEMDDFFHLRWEVLRKPLGMDLGSERSENDEVAYHFAIYESGRVVAGVTAYPRDNKEMILSHLATLPESQNKGYGTKLVEEVEKNAQGKDFERVSLDARENVVNFYERMRYVNKGYSKTFANIKHYRMEKEL